MKIQNSHMGGFLGYRHQRGAEPFQKDDADKAQAFAQEIEKARGKKGLGMSRDTAGARMQVLPKHGRVDLSV